MQEVVILTRGKIQETALGTPWRHMGEVQVQLYSFLSLAMHGSGQLQAPAILPPSIH